MRVWKPAGQLLMTVFCMLLASAPIAQTNPPKATLFSTVPQDISLVVRKHPTGADMVEVTVLNPQYPPTELNRQIEALGTELQCPPRGLSIFVKSIGATGNGNLSFTKATFAINGILNGPQGVNLSAIAKAFAGSAGQGKVQGINVLLDGAKPDSSTVFTYQSPAVEVQGQAVGKPAAIEYRIHLISQDPKSIWIPSRKEDVQAPIIEKIEVKQTPLWVTLGLVFVAALAAGAMVYNFALRRSSRTQASSRTVHR